MNERECETCIKRKSKYCPNSSECYETIEKPHYQNRIMLLEENQQLKNILESYDDLDDIELWINSEEMEVNNERKTNRI